MSRSNGFDFTVAPETLRLVQGYWEGAIQGSGFRVQSSTSHGDSATRDASAKLIRCVAGRGNEAPSEPAGCNLGQLHRTKTCRDVDRRGFLAGRGNDSITGALSLGGEHLEEIPPGTSGLRRVTRPWQIVASEVDEGTQDAKGWTNFESVVVQDLVLPSLPAIYMQLGLGPFPDVSCPSPWACHASFQPSPVPSLSLPGFPDRGTWRCGSVR